MTNFEAITTALQNGDIAVVRTDTIYGIIALADTQLAVEKVFTAKRRNLSKQCIVLVSDPSHIPGYGEHVLRVSSAHTQPTSVIVPATTQPEWLLRGGDTIAYRITRDPFLRSVIEAVGPVIAPSANPEGLPPARTIIEAKNYFKDKVDCYIDGGEVPKTTPASQIIEILEDGATRVIRAA